MLLGLGSVWAQEVDTTQAPIRTKYVLDPETGKLMMYVKVWGEVKKPGMQIVPSDVDLVSVLSYAGGPTNNARLDNIRIIHRYVPASGTPIVEVNLENYLEKGVGELPMILPEDTIIVKASTWRIISGALSYVGVFLQIAQILFYIQTVRTR